MALDLRVGAMRRDYDEPGVATVDDIGGKSTLSWQAARRLGMTLSASRELNETTIPSSPCYMTTEVALAAACSITKHLALDATVTHTDDVYEGISLENETWSGGLKTTYAFNANVALSGEYKFMDRDSDLPSESFDVNIVECVVKYSF